ncbi:golgin subfamily A member 4 isoform X2 [Odontomachus brunneus]|uniref:golgin subfamily A member 4 isoform X2 n=1 Tax=Odontomachus brunneus TaxID=486640 RepID=UPI0013F1DC40|nr:golgin subfamily A member 4 isoform X2 [Odontomachus brunneus]
MFKKFKDKLAEEMKQSPARLQASVQQLAQAVVSPALSNSSIQEVSASTDNFSLTEDGDETPKNTPVKHSFQNIDLMSPSANAEISRRSSVSSITSDASSLFPMYESPPNLYQLQSDMDQSASEVDDNISPHLDRVTKDQLYSAYRKVQAKYHKYRGRYTDLATHYRELDRVKTRLESVLVETQDKVLRRITDLKEQCQLEQQAKAHLEEALRNDIEEKDHIINTLNTKVRLLQAGGSALENSVSEEADVQEENSKDNLIDLTNESPNDGNTALLAENAQLNDRMKKLESLVLRYKESLKRNKDKFTEVIKEKNTLESEYEAHMNATAERISATEGELNAAQTEVARLTELVDVLHKREEESAISLAENKLSVHRELEEKEEQIKQLRVDLKHIMEEKENLNEAVARYKSEPSAKSKSSPHIDSNSVTDKGAIVYDASKEKTESSVKSSVQQATSTRHHEEVDHNKEASAKSSRDENALEEMTLRLREKEAKLEDLQRKLDELEKQSVEYKHDKKTLQAELSNYKVKYSELKSEHDAQRIVTEERQKNADATIEKLQATVQSVDKELENMRDALTDRDLVCENYNKKVQQYAAMLEKAKHRFNEQETQIKSLKSRLDELTMAQQELESKRTELNTMRGELELCRSTIDDLGNKIQADSSAINLLKKERSDLINRLVHYKDCMLRLKQDCADVKGAVHEEFSNRRAEMSDLKTTLTVTFTRLSEENATLNSQAEELRSQMENSERSASEEARLRSELIKITGLKSILETVLRANKEESMAQGDELSDELGALVNKLIAEMDNLQFKVYDLEKVSCELTESRREAESLRERLEALEELELKHRTLSSENDDLRRDLAQVSRAADEVDELSAKLREANNLINSLKSQSSDQDALREEELRTSRAEIARFQDELAGKDHEIKTRDEKIAEQEQQVVHLISTCDSHIQTIEEHVKKCLNLEEEYQAMRESHAKQTTELTESNKELQKTLNVKVAQLKKLKMLKEQQSKTIEEMDAELYELKTKHAKLADTLAAAEKQIEALKSENSQLATIILENKDLKDKHNNLLSHNRKLCENEEAMKQKIDYYEKDIEELRREVESCKVQANKCNEEAERLSGQLMAVNTQLESKNAESSSLNDRLLTSERELRETKERLDEQSTELFNKVSELNAAIMSGDVMREENKLLLTKLKSFEDEVGKTRKRLEVENTQLRSQLGDLMQRNAEMDAIRTENDRLVTERAVLQDRIIEIEGLRSSNTELQSRVSELKALNTENEQLRVELDVLRSASGDSSMELSALKDSLSRKEADIKSLEEKSVDMLREIEALKLRCTEADEKTQEADMLKKKVAELQSEIASVDALRKDLGNVRNDDDSDKLHEENKRLEAQLDEALITFQAKETQMQLVNNELREQLGQLKEQAKTDEEEQGMRLKQLVKEFQAQLQDKEEELQAALEKRFDRQHNYESDLVQQYKEQLKDFQVELTEKSEQIESLVLEKKDVVAEKGKDIDRLVETITQVKKEHANEIREVEKKWKSIVQQKIDNLQAKHEEELNELTKEWQNERKELESTSRVAMAAIQTNTGSIHTMQQTLTSQRREIAELRKLVKLRHDTLEDSTEIEYLRNILFEYMMGRETMVLARVIAAVVKFDQEQTTKIMKKEEDKLTLFGSLGLT